MNAVFCIIGFSSALINTQACNHNVLNKKRPMQASSSLSIALFSRFAPWDWKTCYRHLIYYMFERKLSEKLLLLIYPFIVLGWLY